MCKIQKAVLKDTILTSIQVFEEIKQEKGLIFSSEDVLRAALSLYINSARNGGYPAVAEDLNVKDPEKSIVTFGKYKSKSLESIYAEDKSYLQWLLRKAKSSVIRAGCQKLLSQAVAKVVVPQPKTAVTH